MFFKPWSRKPISLLAVLGALFFVCAFARSSIAQAQADPPYIGEVRIFDPDFRMPNAAGLAYSPTANVFLMLADRNTAPFGEVSDNLTMISPFEERAGSANVPAIANTINMAFDSKAKRLLMFDPAGQQLIALETDPDGYVDPAAISHYNAQPFGVQNPQGMAVDPTSGALFILSEANSQIVRVEPDLQGRFDGEAALADGRVSQIDLSGLGLGTVRGLALNPTNGHLFILNPVLRILYEVSKDGQLVAARELSVLEVGFRDPQAIVFAPSADLTDNPAQVHLFLMDSGLGPLSTGPLGETPDYLPLPSKSCQQPDPEPPDPEADEGKQAEQGPGRIIELTLTRPIEIPR